MTNELTNEVNEVEELTQKEKARQAINAYQRAWRKANRDKIKAYQKKYWAKCYDENQRIDKEVREMLGYD